MEIAIHSLEDECGRIVRLYYCTIVRFYDCDSARFLFVVYPHERLRDDSVSFVDTHVCQGSDSVST